MIRYYYTKQFEVVGREGEIDSEGNFIIPGSILNLKIKKGKHFESEREAALVLIAEIEEEIKGLQGKINFIADKYVYLCSV